MTSSEHTGRVGEIRARLDAATDGPWQDAGDVSGIETASGERITLGDDSGYGCVYIDDADRALIANAPADLTYLLDMADDRQARLEALRSTSASWRDERDRLADRNALLEGQLAKAREQLALVDEHIAYQHKLGRRIAATDDQLEQQRLLGHAEARKALAHDLAGCRHVDEEGITCDY